MRRYYLHPGKTAWVTSLSPSPSLQAVWLEAVLEFTFLCADTEYKFILCLTCKWTSQMEGEELLLDVATSECLLGHGQAHVHPWPGWPGLNATACPWRPAGSVLPRPCTGDFSPTCFAATLPWLSLPVFPEVLGLGPAMEEHGLPPFC